MPLEKSVIGQLNCTSVQMDNAAPPTSIAIFCHGFGAGGTDLVSLAHELVELKPNLATTRFVFPAAPLELEPGYDSRAWWLIDMEKLQRLMTNGEFRELRNESPDRLPICRTMICEIIGQLKQQYKLASNKIFVGGFSQGAMLSTDVALHHPEPLGGLIVWSGALINEADWKRAAAKQSPLKIVQTHGTLDPILPIFGAEALREMLTESKHAVRFESFTGPHTIPPIGLRMAAELLSD